MRNRITTWKSYLSTVIFLTLSAVSLSAQTTTATSTTPSTTPTVTAFNVERALTLTAFNTTLTPSIPTSVLPGIQSGALEIRESLNYSPQDSLLTVNLFTVQVGSQIPTPSTNAASTTFSTYAIKVDKVYGATTPSNTFMFVGTVATNSPVSPFGNLIGAPAAVAIGFTNDTPPKINNAVTLIAGVAVEYSAAASGTLTFTGVPVGPPTTTGPTGPQIVLNVPGAVTINMVALDASGTTGGNPPLTYSWTVMTGTASIASANKATAVATLLGGFGQYTFQVTVTDSSGNTAQKTVTVTYN